MNRNNYLLSRIIFFVCTLCAMVSSGYNFYYEKTLISAIRGTVEGTGAGLGFSLFIFFIIRFSEKLIFQIRYSNIIDALMKNITEDKKHTIYLIIYLTSTTTIGILSSLFFDKIIHLF
jgi:hypothetical protein